MVVAPARGTSSRGATSRHRAAVAASRRAPARWTPRPTRQIRATPDGACHARRCPRHVNLGATAHADVHGRCIHIGIHMAIHRAVLVFPQGCPQLNVDDGRTSLTTTFVTEVPLTCGFSRSAVQLTSVRGCATGRRCISGHILDSWSAVVVHRVLHTVHECRWCT